MVEPVDVGEGGELDVFEAAPWSVAVDEFPFVEAVERLDEGIVVAVALGSNRCDDFVFGEPFGVGNTQILDSAIAVMNQVLEVMSLSTTVENGHL